MTKKELIDKIVNATGITKKDTTAVLEALKEITYSALANHDEIKIFEGLILGTIFRESTVRRNPHTGERIQVEAKYVPKARFGKRIKDLVKS